MGLQGSKLPFTIGEAIEGEGGAHGIWRMHKGQSAEDPNIAVSVFHFSKKNSNEASIEAARNSLRKLKTMRHPYLVEFTDGYEFEEEIILITEPVTTLPLALERLRNEEGHERFCNEAPNLFAWGAYRILNALNFLHKSPSKFRHGCIASLNSILVTRGGDWKLGAFDLCSSSSPTFASETNMIKSFGANLLPSPYALPPEGIAEPEGAVHALDAWQLGSLFAALYSLEGLRIPPQIQQACKNLRQSDPFKRPTCDSLLSLFDSSVIVKTCLFLEEINIKDQTEKDTFFSELVSQLDHFPLSMRKFKIIPSLVNALDYGGANSRVLGPLLKIGVELTHEEFSDMVLPSVIQWFARTDRNMRINLLQNLALIEPHFDANVVENSIYPQVAKGFVDVSPTLRELSLRSLLLLVPKLSSSTVNNSVLRSLAQLQTDPEIDVRANTTICIAKLAQYFSESTREKALIPAFTRALKDPAPKARSAGLRGFIGTLELQPADKCARNILPEVSLLAVDPEAEVRELAVELIAKLLVKLQENLKHMREVSENPQPAPPPSVLSWAVSAIATKNGRSRSSNNQSY